MNVIDIVLIQAQNNGTIVKTYKAL